MLGNNDKGVNAVVSQKHLEQNIDELKEFVGRYSVRSILETIALNLCIMHSGKDIFLTTQLSSPYKQYLYLAGIRISINGGEANIDENGVHRIGELLEKIAHNYAAAYFDSPGKNEEFDKWYRAREISMPAFINYFDSDILNYEEQEVNRIKIWFNHYDNFFEEKFNFTTQSLIDIWYTIVEYLRMKQIEENKRIENIRSTLLDSHQSFLINIEKGISYEEAIEKEREKFSIDDLTLQDIFSIPIQFLYDKFRKETIDNFLEVFCITEQTREFRYYTQKNPFAQQPLWRCSNDSIFCPIYKQLLHAIFDFLYTNLKESSYKEKFYRHRDIAVEKQTKSLFESLFPPTAKFYSSVYEKPDAHNEHDLLILHKNKIFIIEVKAGRIREPLRDPDKAYIRIKRDFCGDTGIQKAYDQALHLKRYIQSANHVSLFNQAGVEVVQINSSQYNECYLFCITADNYGLLGTQLSILLNKPEEEHFPWVCNLYDLENIIHFFKKKKYNLNIFLKYINLRMTYHEKLYAFDELEICGAFLQDEIKGILKKAKKEHFDMIAFSPQMSDIFDDLYFQEKGINISSQLYEANNVDLRNKPHKKKHIEKRQLQKISRKRNRK